MRQYFKNEELNSELSEKGYVVIPFLNNEELSLLLNAFSSIPKDQITQFYATAHHSDLEFRKKMSELIKGALLRALNENMIEMDILGGSYIVKPPHYNQVLQPHQDWNIVDEKIHRSFNVWIPLVDLDETNGAIMVMPGSHKWIRSYRHSSIPCAFLDVHDLLLKNMSTLYLRAGNALIYDHALLHASLENKSDDMRVACASGIKPKEADMFFYWNENGVIQEYESNPDFFMLENVFTGPGTLKKKKDLEYNFVSVNPEQFYNMSGIPAHFIDKNEEDKVSLPSKVELPFWKVYTPMNIYREIKSRILC